MLPVTGRLRELRPHQPPAGGSFSLRAKSRLRRLRSDTRLRAQPLGEAFRNGGSPSGEAFKETAMKGIKTRDPLRTNAQKLRRKMTPQERRLWYDFLKNLPQTVYRQKIIGNFIVDFYISSCKLVIELDGAQHTEPQAVEYDAQRTAYLQGIGCRVLRYANNAVDTNFAGVCEDILHNIG